MIPFLSDLRNTWIRQKNYGTYCLCDIGGLKFSKICMTIIFEANESKFKRFY